MTPMDLSADSAIDHLVLVRAFQEEPLVAVLPNLRGQADALRIVHSLQDEPQSRGV